MRKALQWLAFNLISIAAFAGGHTVIITQTNVLCNGDCNGMASATVSGGVGPFVYSWSNGSNGITATGLCAATYSCTVTDNNDLSTATTAVTINEPPEIIINTTSISDYCGLHNGSLTTAVSGGAAPFDYSWSNGATDQTVSGLSAGTYSLTVKDSYNCSKILNVAINNYGPLPPKAFVSKDIICAGATGSVSVNIFAGNAPYIYSWSNGVSSVTASTISEISNVSAGTYYVEVTDNLGCKVITYTTIPEPVPITIATALSNTLNCKTNSANISANVSGGTGAYTYSWSNGSSGITASNLGCSTYTLSVADANGCIATTAIVVSDVIGIEKYDTEFQLQISPNPSNGNFTIKSEAVLKNGVVMDVLGNIVYRDENIQSHSFDISLSQLSNGIYFLKVTDVQNKEQVRKVIIEH